MNKQKFVEFIKEPAGISATNLEEIEEAVKLHPYFQSARLLLAKASKIRNTDDQKEKIAKAAVYANDRLLLKKYINDDLIFLRTPKALESEHTKKLTPPVSSSDAIVKKVQAPEPQESAAEETAPKHQEAPVIQQNEAKTTEPKTAEPKEPESDLDHLIDDLWHDVAELRKNKARFFEIEKKIEEDEAVDEAVKRATKKASEKHQRQPFKK